MKTELGAAVCLSVLALALFPASYSWAQNITVTAANPNTAPQGTVNLNVTISGSGYKRGAKSAFFVSGTTNPGGIQVNSTAFVDSDHLAANVDVAADAVISGYDIVVTNSDGRSGKGTELFAVTVNKTPQTGGALVRASFRNASGDLLRSDGVATPCGHDYVDKTDLCTGLPIPNAQQASISNNASGSLYVLRTVPACCATPTAPAPWDPYVVQPTRWLVVDFSKSITGNGLNCLDLDNKIANDVAATDWSSLPPEYKPVPPPPVTGCVDNLAVRFDASHVFSGSPSLGISIDEPQLTNGRVQWNRAYSLVFRKVVVTKLNDAAGSVRLATGNNDIADLMDSNSVLKGSYHMPFSMILTPVP